MRPLKTFCLFALILFVFSSPSRAGSLTLGAKASIYNPPEAGANPSLMYGFVLDYEMNKYFHAVGEAMYTSYSAKVKDGTIKRHTLMPITANLVAHFMPGSFVDPYLGLGVGYYSKTIDNVESSSTGGQATGGLTFHMGNFTAGLEIAYIVPNLNKSGEGALSWGGWASGATYVWIPF